MLGVVVRALAQRWGAMVTLKNIQAKIVRLQAEAEAIVKKQWDGRRPPETAIGRYSQD